MLWFFLSGCCRNAVEPILNDPYETQASVGEMLFIDFETIVVDSTLPVKDLQFEIDSNNSEVSVSQSKNGIEISANTDTEATITVTVTDKCESQATKRFDVTFGAGTVEPGECAKKFSYVPQNDVSGVSLTGDFSDWQPIELTETNGTYQKSMVLEKGAYAYKFIEHRSTSNDWTCDPNADLYQCDEGMGWLPDCIAGQSSCNSVIRVDDCSVARMALTNLEHNGSNLAITASGLDNSVNEVRVKLNDAIFNNFTWTNNTLELSVNDLPQGRNLLTLEPLNANGDAGHLLNVPLWNDDFDIDQSTMYFAFVDRFYNGNTENDVSYGANWETGDYMGGDWEGVITKLDYLQELGVNILWLTAPWDNADGIFEGDCGMTITGYHGYWPISVTDLEPQFGDEETLHTLISEAHHRNMRVLVDWVGNHVHEDHPYATNNPNWFTDYHLCRENDNWNQAPETCWFAPYLPTIRYYQTDPIDRMVEDAIDFAKKFDIDGFRVDAVKHIPHAVHYNLQSRIKQELEHTDVGGTFQFYTVGETFSGDRELLGSYVSDTMLDGQFEFGNYWSILSAFAREESALYEAEADIQAGLEFYGDAAMSHFLGNHDVERFISHASGEVASLYGDGLCPTGDWRGPANSPQYYEPYARLRLAWVYLLTIEGPALIYYGDEIGLAGYHDPDNRQEMRFDLTSDESGTLAVVQKMTQLRKDYPQLTHGPRTIWWGEPDQDILAVSRSSEDGEALIVINRSWNERTIVNSLNWAGLNDGNWNDLLNDEQLTSQNDELSITVAPMSARILIRE